MSIYKYKLPILTGILIPASYMPFPPWAIFFCFIPLWNFALKQNTWKDILIGGWICQVVITLCGGNWMTYAIKEFGGHSWASSIIIFCFFATAANLQIPLALALWFTFHKKLKQLPLEKISTLLSYLLLPTLFSLCLLYYPTIFKWHLGYTWFFANWPAAQTAEIWGFQFINSLILFSNLLFLIAFQKPFSLKRILKPMTIGILIFAGLNLWGVYLKHRWPKPTHTAHALMVQPNIKRLSTEQNKNKNYFYTLQTEQLIQNTKKHIPSDQNIDFILWPEGAYMLRLNYELIQHTQNPAIRQYINWLNSPVVITAPLNTANGIANSIFTFNKQGKIIQKPYNKIRLMAFGEYWPFQWIPYSSKLFFKINVHFPHRNTGFLKGNGEFTVVNLNGIHLGFFICYEGLFEHLTRDLSNKGAQILINSSNDKWFGKWQQPYQHFYVTLSRSIEVRRPVLRGTNSGLSGLATAKGDILHRSQLDTNEHWVQSIPYHHKSPSTFYSSWGYYLNPFFLWSILLCILIYGIKIRYISP